MNLTKKWSAGIALFGLALLAVGNSVWAESWRPASERDGPATASVEWQQRVLKRPVTAQQPVAGESADLRQSAPRYRTARHSSYERGPFDTASMTREQVYSSRHRARLVSNEESEVIPPGTAQYEPIAEEGVFAGEGCGESGHCGSCGQPACEECCDFGYECFDGRCGGWLRNLTVFGGGHGFKGPVDWRTNDKTIGSSNGNFGFHEGLGISGPLGGPWGCGYQMGANFVHSNFSGLPATVPGTDRTQYFVTAGVFRREMCRGLQWGVVWDYMHDRYFETFKLHQLRGDIGFVIDEVHEIGFLGAFGVSTDTYDSGKDTIRLDPTDMYAFYFRRNFENGGDGRIWGGGTGRGDGLIGADLWVPLGRGFALQNIINYKIPREGRAGGAAHADESWGLTIQVVWYPGQSALCQRCNPYRPMLGVADNARFMVDQIIH